MGSGEHFVLNKFFFNLDKLFGFLIFVSSGTFLGS